MKLTRRVGLVPLVMSVSLAILGCPLTSPTNVGVTGSPVPGNGGTSTGGGSSTPVPFGTPNYPNARPITSPPPVNPTGSATPTPDGTGTGAATPTPGPLPSMLVVPPTTPEAIPVGQLPTLGQTVVTYIKDGDNDGVTGKPIAYQSLDSVAVDLKGDRYVSDSGNSAIYLIQEASDPSGVPVKTVVTVTTNSGEVGSDGKQIPLRAPHGVAIDGSGNMLVVDSGNQAVRIGHGGTSPAFFTFSTLAGGGAAGYADFVGKDARFNNPYGVAVDASGNAYVTDTNNHCVRKITPAQVVTTLAGSPTAGNADGVGKGASFNSPKGIASDVKGTLYVADTGNNVIRKVTPDGVVTTFAGSGTPGYKNALGTQAQFNAPTGIAVDAAGNVFVSEANSPLIRKISPEGTVTTLAGATDAQPGWVDGPGAVARFKTPVGLAVDNTDPQNDLLFVADPGNNAMREIEPVHCVTTLAGRGRPLTVSPLLLWKKQSNDPLFPANSTCCNGSTTAGFVDGDLQTAQFDEPWAVVVDDNGNAYVADSGNHAIRKVAPDGTVTTLAGSGQPGFADGKGNRARFNAPRALALDGVGNLLVADQLNNCIRKVTPDGTVTTLAGDVEPTHTPGFKNGGLDVATFNNPDGLAIDASGNVFVSDRGNNAIRMISAQGQVSTYAGDGSAGYVDDSAGKARFASPAGLALDAKHNLYVADYGNNVIRVVNAQGVGTLAGGGANPGVGVPGWVDGTGKAALFNDPWGLTVDANGYVYVADYGNSLIRRVDGQGNAVIWAGFVPGYPTGVVPQSGYTDGPAIGAAFAAPAGICMDRQGYLYVADSKNHRIRKIH